MRKVRILISGKGNLQNYINAVNGVGAEAVTEYLPQSVAEYDGLLLSGGGDIEPKYYGEEIDGSTRIDPERDVMEFSMLDTFVRAGKPVLGICRGHQLINVFFGGSLYQDIAESGWHTGEKIHAISTENGSILRALYGASFPVNSSHHQAVKKLGNGLRVTALWEDTYAEAIEHTSLPIIGVQWHPERMCFEHRREDTVDGAKIIEHFVHLCEKKI